MPVRKLPNDPGGRVHTTTYIPKTSDEILKQVAKARNCTVSVLLHEAIEEYIDKLKR